MTGSLPFPDVRKVGLWTALRKTGFVLVMALELVIVFAAIDRRRPTKSLLAQR